MMPQRFLPTAINHLILFTLLLLLPLLTVPESLSPYSDNSLIRYKSLYQSPLKLRKHKLIFSRPCPEENYRLHIQHDHLFDRGKIQGGRREMTLQHQKQTDTRPNKAPSIIQTMSRSPASPQTRLFVQDNESGEMDSC